MSASKQTQIQVFPLLYRILHWLMAIMIIAMLFIGVGMQASLTDYHWLLSVHKPLGIAILILATIRLINRIISKPPALPAEMPQWQKVTAHISHIILYILMIGTPLIGWSMLSAGSYPVMLFGEWQLPSILPANREFYSILRYAHTVFSYSLFAIISLHISAALMHGLIFKDNVLQSMVGIKTKK